MAEKSTGGIVYKAEDGTTYFIRNELLELCKVELEFEDDTERMVEQSRKRPGPFVQPVRIDPKDRGFNHEAILEPEILSSGLRAQDLQRKTASTIMCCW
ncbi:MAG: hypothetical protein M3P34_05345 [Actinomycetota bacterium]|nr:hypothetical protein [Actinomycetota bacterium]